MMNGFMGRCGKIPLYKWRFIAGRINYNPDFVEVGFIVLVVGKSTTWGMQREYVVHCFQGKQIQGYEWHRTTILESHLINKDGL